MKYVYEVKLHNYEQTSVLHCGELEAKDMVEAGLILLDKFEDLEKALEVRLAKK